MIDNIKSINNLGIYKNYKADSELLKFNKYNLFYGWNGSGKTTISRLFRIIEKKEIPFEYNDIKFNIEIDSQKYSEKNYKNINENVFVFNEEFIEENIKWDESINKIIILSQDKIKEIEEYTLIQENINGNEKTGTKGLNTVYLEEKAELDNEKKILDNAYSKIAKNIKIHFQVIDPTDRKYATLNKTKIQKILDNREKLTEIIEDKQNAEETKALIMAFKNEKKETISYVKKEIKIEKFKVLYNKIEKALSRIVTAKVIERLKENDDISVWVNQGLELNRKYNNEVCEFCGGPLTRARIEKLESHFNDEVSKIKTELEELSKKIEAYRINQNDIIIDKNLFYKENINNIDNLNQNIIKEISKLDIRITSLAENIEDKINNPFKKIEIEKFDKIKAIINNYNNYINLQAKYVNETNDKTNNFDKQIKEIKKRLANYYFKNEFNNEDIINKKEQYKNNKEKVDKIRIELDNKLQRLNKLESALSKESLGAEKFNEKLNMFLGYDELRLEFNKELKGYEILRKSTNSKAHKLSEGEKTAIAFVYYLTKLKEHGNKVKNSIIVIDDPISSFDNNKLFNAYSCIIYEFDTCKQMFILTHNFNFFKLIRDWIKTKKDKSQKYYSIYKVEPSIENGIRIGNIRNAGKSLYQNSEYDYVFNIVYKMRNKELDESEIFNCGNACRKLLEAFLSFKFPKQRGNIRALIDRAFSNNDEIQEKNKVYKFINAYSHLDVIESSEISDIDTLLSESNGIVEIILNKIKQLDKEHYDAMVHNSDCRNEM